MDNIYTNIDALISYGIRTCLLDPRDEIFCRNAMLSLLGLSSYEKPSSTDEARPLSQVLECILDWAASKGVITDTGANRDLFDTALMGLLTPKPSEVINKFFTLLKESPQAATDYFYRFCQDCGYIRTERVKRDLRWTTDTEFGILDITINLSKPERDPRDIAAAAERRLPVTNGGYPECLICAENEGYAGNLEHPARQNLRLIPIQIAGERWGLQYSPYVYYNEHCILLNTKHIPMVIDDQIFTKLLSFVEQFPHYFIGSNADLPIVGGSILGHEHFQGGHYEFALERARITRHFDFPGFESIESGIVHWPMSVIRLISADRQLLSRAAARILSRWRAYSDEEAYIFASTNGNRHNTITPIARMRGGKFEVDLVLRNNITTEEHKLGLYHPHKELHNIKRENIGLIEVLGLAVLPGRLKTEMEALGQAVLEGRDLFADERTSIHADWFKRLWGDNPEGLNRDNIDEQLRAGIGRSFEEILRHSGVYSLDSHGQAAFDRFISAL